MSASISDNRYDYDEDSINLWVEPELNEGWQAYLADSPDLQHFNCAVY